MKNSSSHQAICCLIASLSEQQFNHPE
uniref:Uncharacterized protein n=1 Tax=Arundo donax TaxID=35708 RepID=A0A0A9BV18_ARUDO